MKIGVSTSCFYPLETEKSLKEIGENGVKYTEIFFNANCELKQEFVNELIKIKDFYGIEVLSVHPTMSLAESFMLFSSYDRRYDEGIEDYKRYADIASQFGAKYIIMHGGKVNNVMDDDGYFERFYKISKEVNKNGVWVLQENVAKCRANSLDFLRRMSQSLKDDARFCIDVKQCIRGGYSPFDAVKMLGSKVKHLHISDSNGKDDCLLPLNGNFDFNKFFKTAANSGFSDNAVVEVYSSAYKNYSEIFNSFGKLIKFT